MGRRGAASTKVDSNCNQCSSETGSETVVEANAPGMEGVRAAQAEEVGSNRGRALITTKPFKQGEILLQEAPLLVTARKLATIGGATHAKDFDVEYATKAYEALTTRQKGLLSGFSAGEGSLPLELAELVKAQPDLEQVVHFARVVRINAHVHPDGEKAGLYVLVARANHSCNPSCGLASTAGGQLLFYALRDLEIGEEVDYSYLGGHFLLFQTPTRREQLLHTKLFECRCPRCGTSDGINEASQQELVGESPQDRVKAALLAKLQVKVETLEASWSDPSKDVSKYISDWENLAQQCGKLLGAQHHLYARACFFSLQALTTGRCYRVGNVSDERYLKGISLFALPLVAYLKACCPLGARRAALEPIGRAVVELGRTILPPKDPKAVALSALIAETGIDDLRTCFYDESLNGLLRRILDNQSDPSPNELDNTSVLESSADASTDHEKRTR